MWLGRCGGKCIIDLPEDPSLYISRNNFGMTLVTVNCEENALVSSASDDRKDTAVMPSSFLSWNHLAATPPTVFPGCVCDSSHYKVINVCCLKTKYWKDCFCHVHQPALFFVVIIRVYVENVFYKVIDLTPVGGWGLGGTAALKGKRKVVVLCLSSNFRKFWI